MMANRDAASEQPMPSGNGAIVLDRVRADLEDRAATGLERYGTYLRTRNGRDALLDAYQVALDLVMYLAQAIMARE